MMNTWHTIYSTDLEILLKALEEELPELGSAWRKRLAQGYTAEALASDMAIDLREQARQAKKSIDDAQQALLQSVEQAKNQQEALEILLEKKESACQALAEKIIALNRIIAQQQEQLNALLGNDG